VTIAIRPFVGRDGDGYTSDLGVRKSRIFFREGLDRNSGSEPVGQISAEKAKTRGCPANSSSSVIKEFEYEPNEKTFDKVSTKAVNS
jgi:hypothetical protein